ncbi:MAG: ornithine carbamoyltransferase [Chloroflexi bacterium]|nr:ornithine carbamoyltransferase [Chloroflexota bacterium]
MRSYLSVTDLAPDEIIEVLDRAAALKMGTPSNALEGKVGVLIFEKPSLRTKLSFDVGISRLGGRAIYFSPEETEIDVRESAEDIARVVSRMADFAVVRTFEHSAIERFDAAATVPVVNALTDLEHPCQALADLQTIREVRGGFTGFKIAYIGDGNNMAASLALAVASVGGEIEIASPDGYQLKAEMARKAGEIAAITGASVSFVNSPEDAVAGASIVYTDVWVSMGQESEAAVRKKDFAGYQVNEQLLDLAEPDVKFMHDMPVHPGEEVSEGMMDDPRAIVFDQAENRLHAQAGLLDFLFSEG